MSSFRLSQPAKPTRHHGSAFDFPQRDPARALARAALLLSLKVGGEPVIFRGWNREGASA